MAYRLLKTFFDRRRFTGDRSDLLLLFLYMPVGLLILLMRLTLTTVIFSLLYLFSGISFIHRNLLHLMFVTWGIVYSVDRSVTGRKQKARLLVANHVTALDYIPLLMCTDCELVIQSDIPQELCRLFGIETIPPNALNSNYLAMLIGSTISTYLHFPEETITNGKGLLKFSTWWCNAADYIQPIALTVSTPFPNINLAPLGSTWRINLLFHMFVPFTAYNIKYLSVLNVQSGRHPDSLASRAERMISAALDVGLTRFTAKDKARYEKIYLNRLNGGAVIPETDSEEDTVNISKMVAEVRNLLPHVPKNAIVKDLEITDDVENTVQYLIVKFPKEKKPLTEDKSSFLASKKIFLQNARQRYIERHNL